MSVNLEALRQQAVDAVDSFSDELVGLAKRIHANPETAFCERRASGLLIDFLEGKGFRVERGVAGLETAFKASFGRGSPCVAVLCEYDALPKVGHACGHNIIAAAGAGAGAAVKDALNGLKGSIVVIGTPAEESGGGKITMLEKGVFRGVDAAMMVHPATRTMAFRPSLAAVSVFLAFKGRAAHAAGAPHEGINALEAMILTFTGINALRQHLKEGVKIHGIITRGGDAANIVPDHTEAEILVRARTREGLNEVVEKVRRCAQGAGLMTGATPSVELGLMYAERKDNPPMSKRVSEYLRQMGMELSESDVRDGAGSSDMGNVSQEIPAIHPYVAIAPRNVQQHTEEFARAATSPEAMKAILVAAKAMAMTCVDLLGDGSFLDSVKQEFRSK
ncbi:MAG: M20 family metallopeptidase [Firmicutes bacterium]|nr:M20 family metallopeptidase [Bacillota bacterium]